MLNSIIEQLTTNSGSSEITLESFVICIIASILIGILIAFIYQYRNTYHKGFVITLAMLPAIVALVIMMVNGNIGTGVAVAGAFSLVRFRSQPGTAREINAIFFTMATGLATGMGYITIALIFTLIMGIFNFFLVSIPFGEYKRPDSTKELRITVPEDLDYPNIFDDLFVKYSNDYKLLEVKTTNMGSMFKLKYQVEIKPEVNEKEFIDEIRCRNGNLEISSSIAKLAQTEL